MCYLGICEVTCNLMIIIVHGGVPGDDNLSRFQLDIEALEVPLLAVSGCMHLLFHMLLEK